MLAPCDRPEIVIISFGVLPIHVHIAQEGGLPSSFQDTSDIIFPTGEITVLSKAAIAAAKRRQSVKKTSLQKSVRLTDQERALEWSMSWEVLC